MLFLLLKASLMTLGAAAVYGWAQDAYFVVTSQPERARCYRDASPERQAKALYQLRGWLDIHRGNGVKPPAYMLAAEAYLAARVEKRSDSAPGCGHCGSQKSMTGMRACTDCGSPRPGLSG